MIRLFGRKVTASEEFHWKNLFERSRHRAGSLCSNLAESSAAMTFVKDNIKHLRQGIRLILSGK
jgi:hypothetical protein